MAVKYIPEGFHTVTPLLLAKDAGKLIDFLLRAFDATEKERHNSPDGKVMHAEVRIGDSILMLGEASDKYPATPGAYYLYVEDVDTVYKKAIDAGGKSLREPTTEFYGDRSSGVVDEFGNQWWIASHVEDVSPEEMMRRQQEWTKQQAAKQQ
jgi:PhnB protein